MQTLYPQVVPHTCYHFLLFLSFYLIRSIPTRHPPSTHFLNQGFGIDAMRKGSTQLSLTTVADAMYSGSGSHALDISRVLWAADANAAFLLGFS